MSKVRLGTVSLKRLCKLYDWTPKQVAHRRSRCWTEGVHYVKCGDGSDRYCWRVIEDWIESHVPGHRPRFNHAPPTRDRFGLVYLIAGAGKLKIGFTGGSASARLSQLQGASPVPLALLASRAGARSQETALHRKFAHLHCHGEWFEDCPEIRAEFGL